MTTPAGRRPAGGHLRPAARYDLMLRAALGPLDAAGPALRAWRAIEPLDDPDIGVQRLLPLFEHRAAQLAPDDDVLRRRVMHTARFSWMRGQRLLARTAPIVAALQDDGIEVLLLKGAALIQIPGVEIRLRMMDDLDILVRPTALLRAEVIVEGFGLRTPLPIGAQADLTHYLGLTHAAPYDDDRGARIDLHWHALHDQRHDHADDAWWERAVPAALGGVPTLAACPEDVLVQSVVHAKRWEQGAAPRWVVDVTLALRAAGPALDWDRVVQRAVAARIPSVLADALDYVVDVTGVSAPRPALAALRRAPVGFAQRLRTRRQVDPADGGPRSPGPIGRLAEACDEHVGATIAPGTRIGPDGVARLLAREWWLPRARVVPAQAAFLAAGRPWPVRRVARRWRGAPTRPLRDRPAYALGTALRFGLGGNGGPYVGGGWYYPEAFGIWSRGATSYIVLPLGGAVEQDLEIGLEVVGFTTPRLPPRIVEVAANDVRIARLRFADPACPPTHHVVTVPRAAMRGWNRIELMFVARHPVTPADGRKSGDTRRIALGLIGLAT